MEYLAGVLLVIALLWLGAIVRAICKDERDEE
jgi:hypothetical protein